MNMKALRKQITEPVSGKATHIADYQHNTFQTTDTHSFNRIVVTLTDVEQIPKDKKGKIFSFHLASS